MNSEPKQKRFHEDLTNQQVLEVNQEYHALFGASQAHLELMIRFAALMPGTDDPALAVWKRSHDALMKLERMVQLKARTISLFWDGQIIVCLVQNDGKIATALDLVSAIESVKEG